MILPSPLRHRAVPYRFYSVCLLSLCLCGFLLLNGCATTPRGTATEGSVAPADEASARPLVEAFELEGRIAASDGERAANGRVLWQHTADSDEWTVLTPLGQIAAQLVGTPQGARLVTADGQRLDGPDVQSMLPRILGVAAPVAALPYWVQGIPRSSARVLSRDRHGRSARINDSGWIIDYTAYRDPSGDQGGMALPQRLEAHQGEARLRLIIDQWTPLP